MDTRADVIRLCMGLPDSYEDYPFDDPNWTAMRHKTNHKTYPLRSIALRNCRHVRLC